LASTYKLTDDARTEKKGEQQRAATHEMRANGHTQVEIVAETGVPKQTVSRVLADEVKDIRDKALAFEAYAQQVKNTEAECRACEIRLRAERKAGQLLQTKERAGRGGSPKSRSTTLDGLGISRASLATNPQSGNNSLTCRRVSSRLR